MLHKILSRTLFILWLSGSMAIAQEKVLYNDSVLRTEILAQLKPFLDVQRSPTRQLSLRKFAKLRATIHRAILRTYKPYSMLQNTLAEGTFDCVTGSLVYATVLDYYAIPYDIVETDRHVFLLVQFKQPVLLEATDPTAGGLVVGEAAVTAKYHTYIEKYGSRVSAATTSFVEENVSQHNERVISLTELYGLTYYNAALLAYYYDMSAHIALKQLDKAQNFYACHRISTFRALIEDSTTYRQVALPQYYQ